MKKKKKKSNSLYIFVLVVLVAISGLLIAPRFIKKDTTTLDYIKSLEQKDVNEEKEALKRLRKKELKAAVKNGELTVFSLFEDFVIYGDSRVYGFGSFGYFNDALVFANASHTIDNIADWDENLKTINPSTVIIAYGINDLGLKLDEKYHGYKEHFKEMVNEHILAHCPNAKIYINSIITANPTAMANSPNWYEIGNYNKQIEELCKETGWIFVDNSTICDGTDPDVYSGDGVHFSRPFYYIWAENIYDKIELND